MIFIHYFLLVLAQVLDERWKISQNSNNRDLDFRHLDNDVESNESQVNLMDDDD